MEDQIVEWRIVEHTSLEEEEEEEEDNDYDYEGEVRESKMRWIVNKGLWLGKKVMITGIVVSSAPVVLPPLVVISALGFAFSIPFGLAFVGYTCTEKLMNKLLPRSEPPLLLEYGEMYGDDQEEGYDELLGGKDAGFGGEMVMEDEEKKEMEDSKEGVEMRIQLVMDESRGYEDKDFGRAEEEREINVDDGGKEEGYEEDVGEYLEGENEGPVKEMNLETKRGKEAENWEFDEKIKRTEGLDLVARETRGENEGEKGVTLTPGLPERNLVEVYVGDSAKEDNRSLKSSEVVEKPTESKDEKVEKESIEVTKTETGPEVISEEKESIEVTKKPNISKSSKKHHKKKKANEVRTAAIIEKGEGLSNKQQEDSNVKMVEIKEEVRDEVKVKQDEKHLPVKRETKEGRDEVNQSGVSKKAKKADETEKASPGRRDARNGEDAAQATNSTEDHKAVSNGKHVAKDASRQVESEDKPVAAEDAQRKAADVHGNLPSERKGTTDQKKNVNASGVARVPGKAGILEAKHTK
ncbi:PREDICTED: ABC transporter F family member 4-like isoform X2 [Nicotiana attenuata]|nr:PREDICTED: ABC transporter F family member 4-like isoform X2 [Nicotiana attenuata]